ncbi:MAG: type II secretion system GspH family protein [Lentisphaeraceae bacterium]|nr:type II secretion system GspH family protein [Lentisphaeraceae bacterium]
MKRFFTLIELLVVVAIIGILASLLMPALSQAREKAKEAVCSSQLKQVGYAMYLYAEDNADTIVQGWTHSGDTVWQADVHVYMSDSGSYWDSPVWWCPLAEKLGAGRRHYGINIYTRYNNWKGQMAIVPKSEETVMVGELNKNVEGVVPTYLSEGRGNADTYMRSSHSSGKGSSILFVDSHVSPFKRDLSIPANADNQKMWRWW